MLASRRPFSTGAVIWASGRHCWGGSVVDDAWVVLRLLLRMFLRLFRVFGDVFDVSRSCLLLLLLFFWILFDAAVALSLLFSGGCEVRYIIVWYIEIGRTRGLNFLTKACRATTQRNVSMNSWFVYTRSSAWIDWDGMFADWWRCKTRRMISMYCWCRMTPVQAAHYIWIVGNRECILAKRRILARWGEAVLHVSLANDASAWASFVHLMLRRCDDMQRLERSVMIKMVEKTEWSWNARRWLGSMGEGSTTTREGISTFSPANSMNTSACLSMC